MASQDDLIKASSHPKRAALLLRLRAEGREFAPVEIQAAMPETFSNLSTVAYHVRCLAHVGLLKETRQEQRRGTIAHYYALTDLFSGMLVRIAESVVEGGQD